MNGVNEYRECKAASVELKGNWSISVEESNPYDVVLRWDLSLVFLKIWITIIRVTSKIHLWPWFNFQNAY